MKLKFLKDTNEYGEHAVRLNDFDKEEAILFYGVLNQFIKGNDEFIELTDFDFIEPVNCTMELHLSDSDEGITTDDYRHFSCDLSVNGYKMMMKSIEPYCAKETHGAQYLYELDTPIEFLFSGGREKK